MDSDSFALSGAIAQSKGSCYTNLRFAYGPYWHSVLRSPVPAAYHPCWMDRAGAGSEKNSCFFALSLLTLFIIFAIINITKQNQTQEGNELPGKMSM